MKRQFFTVRKWTVRACVAMGAALGLVACHPKPAPSSDDDSSSASDQEEVSDDIGRYEAVYGPPPEEDVYGPPVIIDEPDTASIVIEEEP
ncbi:MAG: hypothetical protein J6X70_02295 [Muribaculaceae bacterium]|nr:hypothetical protein [Muribaculaceae bacterium]